MPDEKGNWTFEGIFNEVQAAYGAVGEQRDFIKKAIAFINAIPLNVVARALNHKDNKFESLKYLEAIQETRSSIETDCILRQDINNFVNEYVKLYITHDRNRRYYNDLNDQEFSSQLTYMDVAIRRHKPIINLVLPIISCLFLFPKELVSFIASEQKQTNVSAAVEETRLVFGLTTGLRLFFIILTLLVWFVESPAATSQAQWDNDEKRLDIFFDLVECRKELTEYCEAIRLKLIENNQIIEYVERINDDYQLKNNQYSPKYRKILELFNSFKKDHSNSINPVIFSINLPSLLGGNLNWTFDNLSYDIEDLAEVDLIFKKCLNKQLVSEAATQATVESQTEIAASPTLVIASPVRKASSVKIDVESLEGIKKGLVRKRVDSYTGSSSTAS